MMTAPEVEQPEEQLTEANVFPGLAGGPLDDKKPLTAEDVFTAGATDAGKGYGAATGGDSNVWPFPGAGPKDQAPDAAVKTVIKGGRGKNADGASAS